MIALGKEVIEELIMNLKDAGCVHDLCDNGDILLNIFDELPKYNNDDLKMLIKSLQCHRCCLLDKLHEEQKKIDCLDYLIYMLKKQMKED